MFLNTDYVDPQTLTGYARAALADFDANQFKLSRWLPNRPVNDLEYRFVKGGEGLIEAATFRAWDTESPIGKRPGLTRVSGELAPISKKIPLAEYARLKQRNLPAEVTSNLYSDTVRLVKSVAARMELARGAALVGGAVTISENGLQASADFGRSGSHSVTAGTTWATASTDILGDLQTWTQLYLDDNGVLPGVILTSRKVLTYLQKNTGFQKIIYGGNSNAPAYLTVDAVQSTLDAYGLPRIETYDVSVNVGGVATKVIADDKVLLLPAADSILGATLYGVTAEAISNDYQITGGDEAGIVAGTWESKDPINLWTKANAVAFPVLANPDFSFVADVIP